MEFETKFDLPVFLLVVACIPLGGQVELDSDMRLKLAVGRCRLQVVSNFPACCGSSYHGLGGGREDDDRLISKCETYTSKNCDALAVHSCRCLCLFFRLIKRLF